jgi:DNA-binding MarR family transcriptional regulator
MDASDNIQEAIEVLQQLGLKEYEARCFVGLSRVDTGTAKRLGELTEVPRTRVYDAIRVLEAQGLVEIQHSSPQRFRAVALEEATETLRDQYDSRVERLQNALETVEVVDDGDEEPVQQVWSMSGQDGIENRTKQIVGAADDEVVFVLCDESLLTDTLVDTLNEIDGNTDLLLGADTESLETDLAEAVPSATTFLSGLDWLRGADEHVGDAAIGRLVLVDRSAILVSSIMPDSREEKAIYGDGFGNGLVVIARRLMSQGLISSRDPRP